MDTRQHVAVRLLAAGYSPHQVATALHAMHTTGLVLAAGRCAHDHEVRPLRMWIGGRQVPPDTDRSQPQPS